MIEEDDVARLLAAQVVAARAHLLDDVAIADRRSHQAQAELLDGALETEVAHHGRDHGAALQRAAFDHVARRERQDRVAVDQVALLVDHLTAVGVAVEADADVGAQLLHLGLAWLPGTPSRRRR